MLRDNIKRCNIVRDWRMWKYFYFSQMLITYTDAERTGDFRKYSCMNVKTKSVRNKPKSGLFLVNRNYMKICIHLQFCCILPIKIVCSVVVYCLYGAYRTFSLHRSCERRRRYWKRDSIRGRIVQIRVHTYVCVCAHVYIEYITALISLLHIYFAYIFISSWSSLEILAFPLTMKYLRTRSTKIKKARNWKGDLHFVSCLFFNKHRKNWT